MNIRETLSRTHLLAWWPLVNAVSLRADFFAAVTSAVMVLPQAIAFAAIAGLPIEYGFYTALVTPVVAALLGSSRHMVSGPTTAISALMFTSLAAQFEPGSAAYIEAAILLTLLAGVFQVAMGALRLGALASFISPSVMLGFTAGAAVTILLSQLPSALGWQVDGQASRQLMDWVGTPVNPQALVLAVVAFIVSMLFARWVPRWPTYLMGLVITTMLAYLLVGGAVLYVEPVPAIIPQLAMPAISWESIRQLSQMSLAMALVGLLEAASIARSLSARSGQSVDLNQEFVGQGLSNLVGSLFSAYMGSGSFTRSAMNYAAGAVTPLAAVMASAILFLLLLLFSDLVQFIPVPAVAGIIILVALRLFDLKEMRHTLQTSRNSSIVMLVTLLSTVVIGLEFGIYVGVLVSLAMFLRRSANPYIAMTAPDPHAEQRYFRNARAFDLDECPQLGCARLDGPLFFGSLAQLRRQLLTLEQDNPQQVNLLLLMKGVSDIDMAGAQLIIDEAKRRQQRGGTLYLTARHRQKTLALKQYDVVDALGEERIFSNKGIALQAIVPRLDPAICARCTARIFQECPPPPASNGADTVAAPG